MATTKPRQSVLYMFDPLASPSTSLRSGNSSPESNSDKENDVPRGKLSPLFARTYVQSKGCTLNPDSDRLIDIGDVTMGDPWSLAAEGGGTEKDLLGDLTVMEDGLLDEPPNLQDSPSNSPAVRRIPLAEIEIEETPRPRQPKFTLAREGSADRYALPSPISEAPAESPLSQVINSINLGAMTISTPQRSSPLAINSPVCEDRVCETVPKIKVVSPPRSEDPTYPTDEPSSSPGLALAALTPPTRRTVAAHPIDPNDPKRCSVDLQSSFSIHMQSPEMSFDLLNDKISFLGQGKDSFWAHGEEHDESEDEFLAPVAEVAEDTIELNLQAERTEESTVTLEDAPRIDLDVDAGLAPKLLTTTECTAILGRIYDDGTQDAPASNGEPCISDSPVTSPVPENFLDCKPSVRAGPAIPALRIIKKTWKMHDRTSSDSSAGSSVSAVSSSTGSSPPQSDQTSTNGIQAVCDLKKTISTVAPLCIKRGPAAVSRVAATAAVPRQSISSSRVVNEPVRRESVSAPKLRPSLDARAQENARRFAAAGIQRPNIKQGERPPPATMPGTASRVQRPPVPPSASTTATARAVRTAGPARPIPITGTTSGLKQPGRAFATNIPAASALPRPPSRLPSAGTRPASGSGIIRPAHAGGSGSRLGFGATSGRF